MQKDYNGWTNYATWRINLEIFDSWREGEVDADILKEHAEAITFMDIEDTNTLCAGYARAFMSDVNYHEIANAINERNKE